MLGLLVVWPIHHFLGGTILILETAVTMSIVRFLLTRENVPSLLLLYDQITNGFINMVLLCLESVAGSEHFSLDLVVGERFS